MEKNKIQVLDLAEYLVLFFNKTGEPITNKKLQKLLYYIQAWNLVYFNHPLFNDEPEAWVHGPVYDGVYQKFKHFSFGPILSPVKDEYIDQATAEKLESLRLDGEQVELLDAILKKYGSYPAWKLEALTHAEKPWMDARSGYGQFERGSKAIKHEVMKSFYSDLLATKKA